MSRAWGAQRLTAATGAVSVAIVALADIFHRKPIEQLRGDAGAAGEAGDAPRLRRVLGAGHLTMMGVGAIVGAGIFSSIGQMAAGGPGTPGAGPALVVSYLGTALACGLDALCYAEIAALVPIRSSAIATTMTAMPSVGAPG